MASRTKRRSRPVGAENGPGRKARRVEVGFEALECRLVLSFAAPAIYAVGQQTSLGQNGFGPQIITGDFNRDGKLDLAETNTADGTVSLLAGKGDGTFQPASTFDTGLGAGNPVWLASTDFNGDGKPDLAIEGGNSVSVLLGNGDGTFGSAKVDPAGSAVRGGLALGDYYGNGRQDIAVTAFGSNAVEILPNNGAGGFSAAVVLTMPSSFSHLRSIASGNFFGNGRADLAVAGNEGYNNVDSTSDPAGVALFENDGKGNFTFKAEYLAVTTADPSGGNGSGDTVNPEHVNVADLNGDGKPDLVLSLYDHNIDVLLNDGNGTFGTAVGYTTETPGSVGGYPRGVTFADVNHDGKPDIITDNFGEPTPADQSTPEPGSIGVLYGNGDGTFQAPLQYTPFLLPGGVAEGDFNGDGLPDLAVTQNYTGHAIGVMLNQPGTAQEPPTVTAAAPGSGPVGGGTVVTLVGTNFLGTTRVAFGSVAATSFTVNSNTSITAVSPAEPAGLVDVTVYDAGVSTTVAADQFTFVAQSKAPTVTAISPAVGPTYGGTSVVITGTNFTGATLVKFGAFASTFSVTSSTSILASAPAEAAGSVDVTVLSPAGTSTTSTADRFTYQSATLSTITVSPTSATLFDGATQLFVATALDQFGKALAPQPSFSWTVNGLGTVTSAGLYAAPSSGTGDSYVNATSGLTSGSARVSYSALTSDIWTGLGTTSHWSDPANWSAKVVPNSGTSVVFNGTSQKNSIVDPAFAGLVASVQTTSLFSGTITLGRGLTVSGTFAEGGGTYNANGFATSIGGLTTLYPHTSYLASTVTQYLNGGLSVQGGLFLGSTGSVLASSVILASGTLAAPSATLYVAGGNFQYAGGAFKADGGTVAYVGTNVSPTLSLGVNSIAFFNFTNALADTYPAGMTITGTLTVAGTFAWKAGAGVISGNIEAQGDVDDENHGGIGNPYLTLDGPANQTIEDLTGGGGGQFRTITINKTGGTVSLACNPIDFSGLTLVAGLVNTGPYAWYVTGPISAAAGWNLGNVEVDGPNVTVVGPNVQVANLTYAAAGDKLTAPTDTLFVSGNWVDAVGGAFVANGGTVVFDGGTGTQQQFTSGGASFHNVSILAGAYLILESDVTILGAISGTGVLNLNGHKILR